MKCFFILFFVIVMCCCCGVFGQDDDASIPESIDFSKMRIKQLKKFLHERGLECKGCAEKTDYVKMAMANEHAPLVEKKRPDKEPKSGGSSYGGDAKMEDLLAQMEKMGMKGNVFSKDDLEKMNKDGKGYEDMFKSGGAGGNFNPPKRPKSKKNKNSFENKGHSEAKEQGSETIEL